MSHFTREKVLKAHDDMKGQRCTFADPIEMRDGTVIGVFNGSYATLVLVDADAVGDKPRQIMDVDYDFVQLLEDAS